jgi:hypothetical protein
MYEITYHRWIEVTFGVIYMPSTAKSCITFIFWRINTATVCPEKMRAIQETASLSWGLSISLSESQSDILM